MSRKVMIVFTSLVVLSMLVTACGTEATPTPATTGSASIPTGGDRKLEIFHWWTAPGEREAADAMFKTLKDKYPDIEVLENPNPGGGGVNQRVVLQTNIAAGTYPDTFQTLGGAELKNYVDSKVLQPLDGLWAELNYGSLIPQPLAKAVTVDGHPYAIPLNMHIQNILYFNKPLFNELTLQPAQTFEDLIATCDKLKASKPDMTCLALGSKEKWGDAFVFDSILLQEGGPDYYVQLYKGLVDVKTDPNYRHALEKFEKLIPYVNADHAGLTWDQAVALVGSGKAAMTLMGTWAIGAFTKGSNWTPGTDFGARIFPQKPDQVLLFHPDTYGITTKPPHPGATADWLRTVASKELQIPTDVIQGGLFARTDIDVKEFPDPIRQELATYVKNAPGKLILDQHGSILPATAQTEYWNILSTFLATPDVDKTINDVANMFTTYKVKDASAWYNWP